MNPEEQLLFEKIGHFKLDDPGVDFSFSHRLARDNGWTRSYTSRVIEEYKKFIFFCCITNTGVTPSDPVDQAWHLHLTYTRSYWIDLCKNTLGKEIHHNPTKGGEKEAKKFEHFYSDLHSLYKEKFIVEPPGDIWHDSLTRFTDIDFQRINLRRYWIIKKRGFPGQTVFIMFGIILFGLISIQAHFDVSFYIAVLFFVVLGVVVFKNRGKGNDGGSGCATSGCGSGGGHGSHGGSGCGSGCSGCSGSGCSGCGGGGN